MDSGLKNQLHHIYKYFRLRIQEYRGSCDEVVIINLSTAKHRRKPNNHGAFWTNSAIITHVINDSFNHY